MAEKRKLINEMEKCFKKIDEGVELFQEIMDKMAEANSDNQREKLQDDLKKEIKKLQRLRDQIKGWQNSSDIKDKDKLLSYRKLIENKMETFKDVERENKTKPHSKQGLSAEEKLDPREREKADILDWLNTQVRKIEEVVDRTESKIELLSSASEGGRKRRGKNDKHDQDKEKLADLKQQLERLKFHSEHLEVCMRMITNDMLNTKDVCNKLKEPLEMYIDALDPDNDEDITHLEPDDIYEELNLSAFMNVHGNAQGDEEKSHKDHSISPTHEEKIRHLSGEHKYNRSKSISSTAPATPATPASVTTPRLTRQSSGDGTSSPPPPQPQFQANFHTPAAIPIKTAPPTKAWANNNLSRQFSSSAQASYAAAAAPRPSSPVLLPPSTPTGTAPSTLESTRHSSSTPPITYAAIAGKTAPEAITPPESTTSEEPQKSIPHSAEPPKEEKVNLHSFASDDINSLSNFSTDQLRDFVRLTKSNISDEPQTAVIHPGDGACPLGKIELTPEMEQQMSLVEAAAAKKPVPMDSEKCRNHLPKMTCNSVNSYPTTLLPNCDTLEYFSKLAPETLFFTFYYMEGTKAQILAAKALKKLSWRYHTKWYTWFQRHEEPIQITDDFERGAYVFFDFERWTQRKNNNFVFEYRYLEDKDVE